MGKKIGSEKIARENGYLYFVGKDGYVWRVPMKHNKRGSKKRVGTSKIAKEKGYLYYVGDDGFVYQAKMKNA
jgi:hypothetical protein